MSDVELLKKAVRTIPDYPKPGILFRDVTTLLGNATAFGTAVTKLAAPWRSKPPSAVAGLEARGFILGGAVAAALGVGFIPVRKRGKLPAATHRVSYALEYGTDELEVHVDAIHAGARVLLVDDLIATGGTAAAALDLLALLGADVVGAAFVIDLPDLGGAAKLRERGVAVHTLIDFPGH